MRNIVFFDIETVVETTDYENNLKKNIRAEKYCNDIGNLTEKQAYFEKGALHPEFAKIICISCSSNIVDNMVSFSGDNEKEILTEFFAWLDRQGPYTLGGHNIKSFDIPFVFRRSLINGIKPHPSFVIGHIKSWDLDLVDTMDLRKQTGFISSGLEVICSCLGLPSPKGNMCGKDVSRLYWENKELIKEIEKYCEGDVRATISIYDRIQEIFGESIPVKSQSQQTQASDKVTEKQVGFMMSLFTKLGIEEDKRKEYLKSKYLVDSSKDLSKTQASEIIDDLQNNPNIKDIIYGSCGIQSQKATNDDLPF